MAYDDFQESCDEVLLVVTMEHHAQLFARQLSTEYLRIHSKAINALQALQSPLQRHNIAVRRCRVSPRRRRHVAGGAASAGAATAAQNVAHAAAAAPPLFR